MHGSKIRLKSARRTFEEVKYYSSKGYKEVYFRDETFTVSRRRVMEFCRLLSSEGLKVNWLANARVDTLDAELMAAMKQSGCHTLKIGVESGNQQILDRVNKGIRIDGPRGTREVFRLAKEIGLCTHAHCMLGMPGETAASVEQTIELVLSIEPTTATFGICTPYPGTPLFEQVRAKHPAIGDGTDSDLSVLHTEGLFNHLYCEVDGEYLKKAIRRAYRRFYLRPSYMLESLRRGIRERTLKNIIISGLNVTDFSLRGE
jgi:radical SAM superfamily enzyme YgiQ (UPF0313 family)